jgi:uncharacterized membrane protein
MTLLILGLVLFLGTHSIRIVADDWRTRQIARLGPYGWKAAYSLASIAGFVLIVYGYGMTREQAIDIWSAPAWTRHLAALLTIVTFVLIAAAYVPGNRIKAAIGHPMIVGAKVWAFAHLISNGRLGDIVLFGAFLAWAVLDFRACRVRDRASAVRYPIGPLSRDIAVVGIGLIAWWLFARYLHGPLIGVNPFS